jgi:hypothetical protein
VTAGPGSQGSLSPQTRGCSPPRGSFHPACLSLHTRGDLPGQEAAPSLFWSSRSRGKRVPCPLLESSPGFACLGYTMLFLFWPTCVSSKMEHLCAGSQPLPWLMNLLLAVFILSCFSVPTARVRQGPGITECHDTQAGRTGEGKVWTHGSCRCNVSWLLSHLKPVGSPGEVVHEPRCHNHTAMMW